MDLLNDLVNESKALTNPIGRPILIKGLAGLQQVTERLVRGHPSADPSRAQLLLAVPQLDLNKHKRVLESIDITRAYEAAPLSALDLDKDLAKRQQQLVNTAIEESNMLTERSFRSHYIHKIEDDWEAEKRRILNDLDIVVDRGDLVSRREIPMQHTHALMAPMAHFKGNDERTLYAERVAEINTLRHQRKDDIDVIKMFSTMVARLEAPNLQDGEEVGEMTVCWNVLRDIVRDEYSSLREHCFQGRYLDGDIKLQRSFMEKSIHYLEKERHETISQNTPAERTTGNRQTRWVRSYLKHSEEYRDDPHRIVKLDGFSLWHQVFLCFRCGVFLDCKELIRQAGKKNLISPELMNAFIDCFDTYHEQSRGGSVSMQDYTLKTIREHYYKVCKGQDEFEKLICAIVGGTFVDNRKDLKNALKLANEYIEDWLWLELRCILVSRDEDVADRLVKLQRKVQVKGQVQDPLLNFKILLLSNQFEKAVYYIVGTKYLLLGVHVAIALNYFGLLRRDDLQDHLFSDACGLNLKQLIVKCIEKPFMSQYPQYAFHYVNLLGEANLGPEVRPAIIQLILDTRAYDVLIGKLDAAAPAHVLQNEKGCVYKFFGDQLAQQIVEEAGDQADQTEGRTLDAIKLYRLAERQTRTAQMLLKQFGRFLNRRPDDKARVALQEVLQEFLAPLLEKPSHGGHGAMAMNQAGHPRERLSDDLKDNLRWAIILSRFFDCYHAGSASYAPAQQLLEQVPFFNQWSLARDGTDDSSKAQLSSLHEALKAQVEAVALAAMTIYVDQHERLKRELEHAHVPHAAAYQTRQHLQRIQDAGHRIMSTAQSNAYATHSRKLLELESRLR